MPRRHAEPSQSVPLRHVSPSRVLPYPAVLTTLALRTQSYATFRHISCSTVPVRHAYARHATPTPYDAPHPRGPDHYDTPDPNSPYPHDIPSLAVTSPTNTTRQARTGRDNPLRQAKSCHRSACHPKPLRRAMHNRTLTTTLARTEQASRHAIHEQSVLTSPVKSFPVCTTSPHAHFRFAPTSQAQPDLNDDPRQAAARRVMPSRQATLGHTAPRQYDTPQLTQPRHYDGPNTFAPARRPKPGRYEPRLLDNPWHVAPSQYDDPNTDDSCRFDFLSRGDSARYDSSQCDRPVLTPADQTRTTRQP